MDSTVYTETLVVIFVTAMVMAMNERDTSLEKYYRFMEMP
jgi:hypothetical protein